ncbi:MAG: PAS domain S-box protein [Calditrichaeota bacterium]|nr:MAG: PAS domain S-box protein [Calditrichota bacterium]
MVTKKQSSFSYDVLLIDEDKNQLQKMAKLLEQNGFVVHAAPNKQTALRIFQEQECTLALLNIHASIEFGLEILTALQTLNSHVQTIVTTNAELHLNNPFKSFKNIVICHTGNDGNMHHVLNHVQRAFNQLLEKHCHSLEKKLDKKADLLVILREQFFKFYNNNPSMYLTLKRDGTISSINMYGARLLGYDKSELIGNDATLIVHPEDRESFQSHIASFSDVESCGIPWEMRIMRKDGTTFWVRNTAQKVNKIYGDEVLFISSVDITQLKKSEINLRLSENKYRTHFEHSADALLIIKNNKFVDCNAATLEMLGYTDKKELFETHPSQLSPEKQPDGRNSYEKADEMMAMAFEKGSHRFEWNHKRKNGEIFPVEVLLTAIPIESETFLHVVWRDITERKLSEKALRKSEEKYRILVENAVEIILVVQDGRIEFINHRCRKLLGYEPEEMYGKYIHNYLHPEDRDMVIKRHQQRMMGENPSENYTFRILDNKGNTKWVEINIARIDWNEKPATLNFLTDITDRKQAEKDKSILETQLRRSQKMETIGTLAGGIAHDFNNLLTPILGYADMALMRVDKDDTLYPDMQCIMNAAKQAKDLVLQILTFSRQTEHERKPLALHLIVKETLQFLRPTLPVTIQIQKKINRDCSKVIADATQMHQVIMNLCTNAFHAMEETGGILRIELDQIPFNEDVHLLHPGLKAQDHVRLTVSDTGCGMDNFTKERIFEPFFSTKKGGKGTGLGLSVVHGIVHSHGGDISVQSEKLHGTTFHVFLPAQQNHTYQPTTTKASIRKGEENILLVDDERIIVQMLKRMLEEFGHTVFAYTKSNEALAALREKPGFIDLLITDLTMPVMTGLELTREVKKVRSDLPVIMITGYSEKLSEGLIHGYGISQIISKPIRTTEITGAIGKVFDLEQNEVAT